MGRRISRTAGGTTTQFLSSGSQIWLEAVGGTTTATYTYGNSLIRKDGETPMFDGLGSERTVTNSSQTVTGTITFEGFGATIATTGSSGNPYKFAATSGYRDDGDAGLTHVGARYYDGQVGRFITRDTFLDQKPYLYCEHNPVNCLDPSGHWVWILILLLLIGTEQPADPPTHYYDPRNDRNEMFAILPFFRGRGRGGDLPSTGPKNGSLVKDFGGGKGQIRDYDGMGRAKVDYDFGHNHGAGDPHAHDWNWGGPRPIRLPGRPLRPGE